MYLLEVVAGLGALQGALLLTLIGLRFRSAKNVPLALLVLVFSLRLGTIPSWNMETLLAHRWVYPATAPLPFLFGPLLWWYARALVRNSLAKPPYAPLHFVPYVAETAAVLITVYSADAATYTALVASIFEGSPPLWLPIRNALKVVFNAGYIAAVAYTAFGPPGEHVSRAQKTWLRALVFVPLASLLPFAFVAVYGPASAQLASGESLAFTLVAAGMAILIYAITMLVIIAPEVTKLSASTMTPGRSAPFAEDQCQALTARVMKVMEDGAYLDPELSEASCAQRLGVHPNRLSAAVNYVTGESFRRLLNRYRLQCFVDRISDGPDADGTLLHVALDCGFPSKTTFNRVFREVYGMPPSVWIARGRTRPPA